MDTPATIPRARAPAGAGGARPAAAPRPTRLPGASRPRALDLEAIASRWQIALDAADLALSATSASLPGGELGRRRRALALERQETAEALARSARVAGVPAPWLCAVPVTRGMLGLPSSTRACLFDLDGVLTDSGVLHAWAWSVVFDDFLLRLSEKTGWHFIPFDRDRDYRAYVDGRTRLEAVDGFLESRGIRVPAGSADDRHDADTAWGLGRRKGEMVARALQGRGVSVLAGARRYLEAAGRAGIGRSVISASASTQRMLERAGLATLLEDRIDDEAIRLERLRSRPAPDVPLASCRRLGVRPDEAVAFTHSPGGVAAARAAGLSVVGVGDDLQRTILSRAGADRVVPSLAALLDRRLSAHEPR